MLASQYEPDVAKNQTRDQHFLYIFGGIKVLDYEQSYARPDFNVKWISSYEYMADMWKYDLKSDQWENLEVYGITSIRR